MDSSPLKRTRWLYHINQEGGNFLSGEGGVGEKIWEKNALTPEMVFFNTHCATKFPSNAIHRMHVRVYSDIHLILSRNNIILKWCIYRTQETVFPVGKIRTIKLNKNRWFTSWFVEAKLNHSYQTPNFQSSQVLNK